MKKKYPPRGSEFHDSALEVQRPIFGVDIDGTLGRYHIHFIAFAEAWLGRNLPPAEEYHGGPFWRYLGLSKTTYRTIKLAYRRGGIKRSMPPVLGARDLTCSLRRRGAIIVLATTRPYLSMENVDADTRHWAKRRGIQHDAIIWGENKYRDLARFKSRIVSILDDEPAMLAQARKCGLVTNRINTSYNEAAPADFFCRDLEVASIFMHGQLTEWERENR